MRLFHVCLSSQKVVRRSVRPLSATTAATADTISTNSRKHCTFISSCTTTSSSTSSSMLHSLFSRLESSPSYQSLSFLCLLLYISFSLTTVVCSAQQSQAGPNQLQTYSGGGGGSGNSVGGSRPYAHSFYDHHLLPMVNDENRIDAAASLNPNGRWPAQASRDRYYYGAESGLTAPEILQQQQLQHPHQQPNVLHDRYLQFRDWLANPLQYLRHHNILKQIMPTNGVAVKQPSIGASSETTSPPTSTTSTSTSTPAPRLEDRAFGTVNRKPELSSLAPVATDSQQISFIMKTPKGADSHSGVQKGPSYGVVRTSPNRNRARMASSRARSGGNSRPQIVPVFDPFGNEMGQFSLDYGKKANAVGMPRQETKEGGIPLYGGDMGIIPGSFHNEPVEQPFAKFSPNRKFVGDEAPKRMRSSSGQFGRGRNNASSNSNAGRRYHVMRAM